MKKTDENLTEQAKRSFDESVDRLDAATLSRLNRSRHAALAEVGRREREWLRWAPATGVAAALLLTVFVLRGPADVGVITAPANDLDILLSEESIEMLEDLEFYSWLDTEDFESDGDLG